MRVLAAIPRVLCSVHVAQQILLESEITRKASSTSWFVESSVTGIPQSFLLAVLQSQFSYWWECHTVCNRTHPGNVPRGPLPRH
jgi:hypothetical protein